MKKFYTPWTKTPDFAEYVVSELGRNYGQGKFVVTVLVGGQEKIRREFFTTINGSPHMLGSDETGAYRFFTWLLGEYVQEAQNNADYHRTQGGFRDPENGIEILIDQEHAS